MTNSALRVGLIVPRFAPFHGGVETYTAQAAAALAAKGAEVTVVTQVPRGAGLPRHALRDGYTVERHHLPIGDILDVPSAAAARAASRSGRFDVVWVHNYHTPLAWLVAEQAKVPLVFSPHYHGVGHTPLRQALHRPYRLAGRRLMAASRRIVVDTDAEAALVLRDFPRPGTARKNHRGSASGGRSGAWTAAVPRRVARRADRRPPGTIQAHRPAHPCGCRAAQPGRACPARRRRGRVRHGRLPRARRSARGRGCRDIHRRTWTRRRSDAGGRRRRCTRPPVGRRRTALGWLRRS